MINPVLQALRQELLVKNKKQLNILCMPTHEGYQTMLSKTGHNFYMIGDVVKNWDYHTRKLPDNHYIIKPHEGSYRFDLSFDLVLSQERSTQLPLLRQLADQMKIPLVHLEHTEPRPEWTHKQRQRLDSVRADVYVYITEYNRKSWNDESASVIYHGIDTDLFQPVEVKTIGELYPHGISVVNLFPQRDVFCGWTLWQQIASVVPVKLYGYNPGLSESINDPKLLNEKLNYHKFFLNTSQLSPIPLSLLEAAAAGRPIVTTKKQDIPKVFTHDENCLMSNDTEELIAFCKELLTNKDMANKLGSNARNLILQKYSMDAFVANWNNLFNEVL